MDSNYLPLVLAGVAGVVSLAAAFGAFKFLRAKLNALFDFLAVKTKLGFLASLDEILVGFATDLYRSEIKILKASGRWDSSTQAEMFDVLKNKAVQHFGFDALATMVGSGSSMEVAELVSSRAHTAITEAKSRGKAAKVDPSKA